MSQTATEPLYEVVSAATGQVVCKPVPHIVARAIADALPGGGSVRPLHPDPVEKFLGLQTEATEVIASILVSLDDHLGVDPDTVQWGHVDDMREIVTRLQSVWAFIQRTERAAFRPYGWFVEQQGEP